MIVLRKFGEILKEVEEYIVILTYYAIIIMLVLFRINILDQLVAHVAITVLIGGKNG